MLLDAGSEQSLTCKGTVIAIVTATIAAAAATGGGQWQLKSTPVTDIHEGLL